MPPLNRVILALDTATESCSVALWLPGDTIYARDTDTARQHTRVLFRFVEEVLTEAGVSQHDIGLLACGRGPGAFTGVRIAIAVTQGLSLALAAPIMPVNNLQATAADGLQRLRRQGSKLPCQGLILAAVDARMGEVYTETFEYDKNSLRSTGPATLHTPETLKDRIEKKTPDALAGNAFSAFPALAGLSIPCADHATSHARQIIRLAQTQWETGMTPLDDPACLQPLYVRDQVTHSPA